MRAARACPVALLVHLHAQILKPMVPLQGCSAANSCCPHAAAATGYCLLLTPTLDSILGITAQNDITAGQTPVIKSILASLTAGGHHHR